MRAFKDGMRDGIPIALGYFAVSFSLGIAAKNAGLTPFESFLTSVLCNASAGEYAGFVSISENAAYIELAVVMFIANIRYLLMSCAMSQRISDNTSIFHRLFISNYITDEIFGIAISRKGYINPHYIYGAAILASPAWGVGTLLGAVAGNVLPIRIVSALGVALYGMFLAIIIPPSRENKVIGAIVIICFILSYLMSTLPVLSDLSSGGRTIILTVVIGAFAAILFPVADETEGTTNDA